MTRLLHAHGALAFWDFAAAGTVRGHRDESGGRGATRDGDKDAVFLSPHKFIGGPGHARRPGGAP